jgi:nucleoside-diphosphate-sugar epimerase
MKALVTGAGGFIGSHLVDALVEDGFHVVATDIKPLISWDNVNSETHVFPNLDLNESNDCELLFKYGPYDEVYNLAANMGGMGYIETHKLECMLNVLISTNMLRSAHRHGVKRFFYASSACVYSAEKQSEADIKPLVESDAYPAMPEDGYGWEKLFSERLAGHYNEETDMEVRAARYHNVYGPRSTWQGGREKAPAAIARKVAEAVKSGNHQIEIWGDGEQTRSFMYYSDCVYGTREILRSDIKDPINLGSSEMVTINELVDIVENIAGVTLERQYNLGAPKGVRGRNSDNSLILRKLGWEPSLSLEYGMERTYKWIYDRIN